MPPAPLPLDQRTFGAVLFDMDGTLIDSIPAVERSWLTWAAENSVAPELLLGFHGVPALGVIGALLPDLDAADIAFLTAYGSAVLNSQSVQVQAVP